MSSNSANLVAISLDTLLVFCLVLTALATSEYNLETQDSSNTKEEVSQDSFLSSPEECARTCLVDEPAKTCYYHFTVEIYTAVGRACELCTPNKTDTFQNNCECVPADGVERSVLTFNRMIPGPSIEICKGDKVVVDVQNNMEGMDITIHWHGILQNGYQYYDGVPMVTQCPISQGNTFRYQWVAENSGTHFYHSHSGLQKMDGLYGSLIVREPSESDLNGDQYEEDSSENVMLISDWMHELATERYPGLRNIKPGQTPESALFNGKGRYTDPQTGFTTNTSYEVFTIKPGYRHRFRLINGFCSVCPAQLNFEGHGLTLIAADGEAVQPVEINTMISFSGERYDFIINADQPPDAYWIQLRALGQCGIDRVQQLAILRYEGGPDMPSSEPPNYDNGLPQGVIFNPLDAICDIPRKDAICISQLKHVSPIDEGILKPQPDIKIFLPFHFLLNSVEEIFQPGTYDHFLLVADGDMVTAVINGLSFKFPSAPPLSQINDIPPEEFCNEYKKPTNCSRICTCTHRIDIPLYSIVELVLFDDMGTLNLSHPFHLHGYNFNVIGMGRSPFKNITKITLDHVRDLDNRGLLKRNLDMMPFKDTIPVPNNGYAILRFRADNPGEWLLHCHFVYHIPIGMGVILHVGIPEDLPPVPNDFPVCGNFLPSITPVDEDYDDD